MATYQEHITRVMKERGPDHPVWKYNDKLAGRLLAKQAGVRCPQVILGPTQMKNFPPPVVSGVLKPVTGCTSRGVVPFIPSGIDEYRLPLSGEVLSWEQITKRALQAKHTPLNKRLLARDHPDAVRPPWIIEQLIRDGSYASGISCDWKAWVIGGKVQMIGQYVRGQNVHVCWRGPQWEPVGKVRDSRKWTYNESLPLPHQPEKMIDAFEAIARLFPAEFVRVDLFEDKTGPVFGEVTPHPAGGKTEFIKQWDIRLGEAWDAALK